MGHCGGFDNAQWAIAANLVLRYGPLRRFFLCPISQCIERSPTVKICDNFRAVGHSAGFGYELWARAKDLVMHYEPQSRILFCAAITPSAGFGYELWSIA
jgi:hypothetical protein